MYEEAQKQGLPTPLDNPPTYSSNFDILLKTFWDIIQYKVDYTEYMPLTLIESYQNLFDISIHPTYITLLCKLDRAYVIQSNKLLKEQK